MTDQFLTLDQFTPLIHQSFDLLVSEQQIVSFELIAVVPGRVHDAALRRAPFSLVWRGPKAPVFPQRIYRLRHALMGNLDIFIVPVGTDESGVHYEAVFA